jgi:hypothetical protein
MRNALKSSTRIPVFSQKEMTLEEIVQAGYMCAMRGCTKHFNGKLPKGWSWLLMHAHPEPIIHLAELKAPEWLRDACLCPEHARMIYGALIPLSRELAGPALGNA